MQQEQTAPEFYASTRSLYNQTNMKNVVGMSNVKIMDGEDLSKHRFCVDSQASATGRECNSYNKKCGSSSRWRTRTPEKPRKRPTTSTISPLFLTPSFYDSQTLAINKMKGCLEDEHHRRRHVQEVRQQSANQKLVRNRPLL